MRSKTVPVPLTPGSKLTWLGTTDVGSPCTYDSTGILRLYDVSSGVWMPICDTNGHSKGASDSWFIVSVSIIFNGFNGRAISLQHSLCLSAFVTSLYKCNQHWQGLILDLIKSRKTSLRLRNHMI